MNKRTLSWQEFEQHMHEEQITIVNRDSDSLASVVIRSGGGFDYGVAAIHREGDILVFDMGHALKEMP